ncbi:YigZ family protein [Streptococcus azizii]|uniref:YigZ family protein n=1 Tax=Streptococcus azizii TaxID=1579424 RepID=A0AB36JV28_9STRE|nr:MULTISPECIES: YigZ family protein [Streptococcus]MBF0775350.1 YigZ family protein [Streptococcus sp. 19428wD3_AN2]ONK29620.1 YigZ family protein [Streptococcus azizii]ONK30129.1 YigZ family protein [Streptococcus azizii]ONK30904.1 YigZ family protein [Streptococcus azizii]TFU84874.1 YigZ family protein [Streptococcus sp. AN2]
MKEYKTIATDGFAEEDIKKSRFICHLKRVASEEEARDFINTIKKEHYRATHNCSAFILGENMEIKRSSDDGEPSGTAGVPMLTVLENNQLTNVAAVVTRYFGGIKLGAGGLIRAYAGAVAHAIAQLGMVEVKEQQGMVITMNYAQYQEFAKWRMTHNLEEYDTEFLADIRTMIFTDKKDRQDIISSLTEFYHGKIQVTSADSRIVEIPVH